MLYIRRVYGELVMSIGAILTLLVTLAAIDDRVREQVSLRMGSPARASAEIAGAGGQIRDLTGVVIEAMRDQSIDHAPMVIFVLAGVVFFVFMLRT